MHFDESSAFTVSALKVELAHVTMQATEMMLPVH